MKKIHLILFASFLVVGRAYAMEKEEFQVGPSSLSMEQPQEMTLRQPDKNNNARKKKKCFCCKIPCLDTSCSSCCTKECKENCLINLYLPCIGYHLCKILHSDR